MYILAIETTGPLCSVALLKDNKILAVKESKEQKNHLRDLMPITGQLLKDAAVDKKELDYIAVSKGPGSFTGIRIGVTTARALGQVLNIPAVAVGTLDGFCAKPQSRCTGRVTCGIINARRGQVYGIVEGFKPGGPYMLADILETLKAEVLPQGLKTEFFGDGIDAYRDNILKDLGDSGYALNEDFFFADEGYRYQDAGSVGLLAFEKIAKGEVIPATELFPDYMRKAEAQQKLEAEVSVRKAEERDVQGIASLEKVCFADPWSVESVYHDVVENKMAFYFVAEAEGKVIGYAGVWNILDEGHITNVAVSPDYRRRHVGTLLIDELLRNTESAGIKRHTLEVRAGNEGAIALYRKHGFKVCGIRKGYYIDNGEDALIMWRE